MARKTKTSFSDLPSLFDDLDLPEVPNIPARAPKPPVEPSPDLFYMSFGSGSSGNCAYIGDSHGGLLVDAGIDPDVVFDTLLHRGVTPEMVKGIIVTHDHGDHTRYLYTIVRRHRHIGVYCTPRAFNGIMRRHSVSRRLKDYHRPIYKEFPFKIGEFEITAFDVSHDGTDNAGFFVTRGKHAFAIATDLGCITERVEHYMTRANLIMLEANYDSQMLAMGSYPEYLKARIRAANGHLDNTVTADFLSRIYTPALRAIFLCHLSNDNNTPEKALDTIRGQLVAKHPGITIGDCTDSIASRDADVQLMALPRYEPTAFFRFR